MKINLEDSVKKWYIEIFPEESDFVEELEGDISFQDLVDIFTRGDDFYKFTNISDSIVRENIFAGLKDVLNGCGKYEEVTYDDIYRAWIDNKPINLVEKIYL